MLDNQYPVTSNKYLLKNIPKSAIPACAKPLRRRQAKSEIDDAARSLQTKNQLSSDFGNGPM
jgi:hypothetical protein